MLGRCTILSYIPVPNLFILHTLEISGVYVHGASSYTRALLPLKSSIQMFHYLNPFTSL
jgi:hypothetical protein